MRILFRENEEEKPQKESIAIYHIVKKSNTFITKRIEAEAKIADMFISDVETKFEFMLFNESHDFSYIDLFIHFRKEWERMITNLERRKFQHIRINKNHFDNMYAPQ